MLVLVPMLLAVVVSTLTSLCRKFESLVANTASFMLGRSGILAVDDSFPAVWAESEEWGTNRAQMMFTRLESDVCWPFKADGTFRSRAETRSRSLALMQGDESVLITDPCLPAEDGFDLL